MWLNPWLWDKLRGVERGLDKVVREGTEKTVSEATGTWKRAAQDTMAATVRPLRAFPSTDLPGVRSRGRDW